MATEKSDDALGGECPVWQQQLARIIGLHEISDLRMLLWVTMYFAFTYITWTAYQDVSTPTVMFCIVLLSYFAFAGATITHNVMHCKVFHCESVNLLFQVLLSLTYGHPVSTFVPGHNLSHHRFTQLVKDPMRTGKLRYSWNLINCLLFQITVAGSVFKGDMRFLQLEKYRGRKFYANCVREFSAVGLQAVILFCVSPIRFILLIYIPHFCGQWGIVTMNMLQHDGCDVVPYDQQRQNFNGSRNFVGSWINYLTFNNGYHSIHHMLPRLHWSRLPLEHDKQVKPFIHKELDQENMASYMWNAFVYPGKRVRFDGEPVVFDGPEPEDEDFMEGMYPSGKSESDFKPPAIDFKFILTAIPVLPLKLLCPTYSPIFKVD